MSNMRENFLEPETRCDTYISAEKKLAWKCMLDMLEEFIRVCKKYNFTYYAMGGTMLGAARHQGMIPWDDDIDVMMPREDYDRIQEVLQKELPSYMFLQSTLTDEQYMNPHLKIRDSRTSGIDLRYVSKGYHFNHGIFIDIFPLDGCPDDESQLRRQIRKSVFWKRCELFTYGNNHKTPKALLKHYYCRLVVALMGRARYYRLRERFFAKYDIASCGRLVASAATFGYDTRYAWPVELFDGETIELPFEYLTVSVPKQYEKILSITYGDWHTLVRGDSMHGELILDARTPYPQKLLGMTL